MHSAASGRLDRPITIDVEERYDVADTLYMNRGAMSWKFGFDVYRTRCRT